VKTRTTYIALSILLVASAVGRAWIAGLIELGNDEVYYLTYAKYPAMSHFDHPPMVGWVIQFFTLNLRFSSEFFIRLGAVVLGTFSTLLMFLIGRRIKGPATGLYAALLFTASFYGFVLSGTFILPDAPQVFFWLLTLFLAVEAFFPREEAGRSRTWLIGLAGVAAGLAFLSKYHGAFLLAGLFLYVLFHDRRWFREPSTWAGLVFFLLLCLPVYLWNRSNGFVSFTFHESRVSLTGGGIKPQYLLTELAGQFFYNNPVNVVIIFLALIAVVGGKPFMAAKPMAILLWTSLPLLLMFTSFSLFRSTLPHWTGPAYLGLILIAAAWLDHRGDEDKRVLPWPVGLSLALTVAVTVLAVGQIRSGWIPSGSYSRQDVSKDLAGWRQLGTKFAAVAARDVKEGRMQAGSPLLTFRWFPAANFDYYVARPLHRYTYALGSLERIHKFHWINKERGNIRKGSRAYYIALSDDYEDPRTLYGALFDSVSGADTLYITRGRDTIRNAYVYRLTGLKKEIRF